MTKIVKFEVIHFEDEVVDRSNGNKRRGVVILIYALGQDGVVYEMSGGKWLALPLDKDHMRLANV